MSVYNGYLLEMREFMELQVVGTQPISERNPLINYLADLQSEKSRRTIKSCLRIIASLSGYDDYAKLDWSKLRREHLARLRGLMIELEYAPQTINLTLSAARGIAKQAWMLEQIPEREYLLIKEVKNVKAHREPKGRVISHKDLKALFRTCDDGTKMGKRDAAIIAFLLGSGSRRSETEWIADAEGIARIDFEDQSVRVIGKGNKERTIFLFVCTGEALQDWLLARGGAENTPLFPAFDKGDKITIQRLSGQAIYDMLRKRSLQAGIKVALPHDFRRTFITWQLQHGADLGTVQDQAGHANPATTKLYDRRGDEAKKKAAQRCYIPI